MELAVFILAWLLVNTWVSLAIIQFDGGYLRGWDDLAYLVLVAIISPWVFLGVRAIYKFFKKRG